MAREQVVTERSIQIDQAVTWGAILVGGASNRMGTDKALVEVAGKPLIAIVNQALLDAGVSTRMAVGGDATAYRRCVPDLLTVPDDYPREGPLGGIITALRMAPSNDAKMVILACDLPGVCRESVLAVLAVLDANPGAQVGVATQKGQLEPLHAVWRRSALSEIEAAFASGERAVHTVLENLVTVVVDDLDPTWLRNVNSPKDLLD